MNENFEINHIKFADTYIPESWLFDSGLESIKIPIIFSFFLVKTGIRKILIDVGCENSSIFELENYVHPITALSNLNICSDDITDIIITHAHFDHIECVKYYPNANVYIQKQEYSRGLGYLKHNRQIITFENEIEICEGISAIKIGGHTTGSSIVECKDTNNTIIFCGDECYSKYDFKTLVPTAKTVNLTASTEFLQKYSDKQYFCRLTHEF